MYKGHVRSTGAVSFIADERHSCLVDPYIFLAVCHCDVERLGDL